MFNWIREKFGAVVITLIVGFIAFVFIFYGVFSPRSTRGLHEGSVAGVVNGDSISLSEFNRAVNQRMEFFKSLSGGGTKFSDEQLKAFRIKSMVFESLVQRKLMAQEAHKSGMQASDEEVKTKVREMPVFQKDGKFDFMTYRQVLEANNYSPGGFERSLREDLSVQRLQDYLSKRIKVSDTEIRSEFLLGEDKRNVKYVLLTSEIGKKGVKVDAGEIKKFFGDKTKLNLARSNFEVKKNKDFKGKDFESVKESIAKDIIAIEKFDEIRKVNDKIADEVLSLLSIKDSADKRVNDVLKPYGSEVKKTGFVSRLNTSLPGIGEVKELLKDAFAKNSPIDATNGGKANKYNSGGWVVVALVCESQKPDPSKLETKKRQLLQQIISRKGREVFEAWMKKIHSLADIDMNPSVVNDDV